VEGPKPKRRRKYRTKAILARLHPQFDVFAGYPVLVALSQRPMTIRELTHALQMSMSAVRKRVLTLESAGHIVQRFIDKRWVLRHRLVAETPQDALQTQQEPVREVLGGDITSDTQPDSAAPEGAVRVSVAYGVPVQIKKLGWARVFTQANCVFCSKDTRLRYGSSIVCVDCARETRKG